MIPESDCIHHYASVRSNKHKIGPKAVSLSELHHLGIPVPAGIVLGQELFFNHLLRCMGEEGMKRLETFLVNKLDLLDFFAGIREKIIDTALDADSMEHIRYALSKEGVDKPFAVRSSCISEDSKEISFAGIFESYLNVDKENLETHIKLCWASAFSDRAVLTYGNSMLSLESLAMSVIIQKCIDGVYSGILFTRDPSDISRAASILELVEGYGTGLAGQGSVLERLEISEGMKVESKYLTHEQMDFLRGIGEKAENNFGYPQDIEWTYDGNRIWILQSRPITTGKEKPLYEVTLADVEDLPGDFVFGDALALHERYLQKKYFLRMFCRENNIPTNRWMWLRYDFETLGKMPEEQLVNAFKAPYVFVDMNQNIKGINLKKEDLKAWLTGHSTSKPYSVRLRESIPTEMAVISSVIEDGKVLIEFCIGAMKGIVSGVVTTSNIIVDREGLVLQENLREQSHYYEIDAESKLVVLRENIKENRIDSSFIKMIAAATIKLNARRSGTCPEWWIWKGTAYLTDASEGKSGPPVSSISKGIITINSGYVDGIVISEESLGIEDVEYLSHGFAISVSHQEESFSDISHIKKAIEKVKELKKTNKKVILAAKKPYLVFSPLLKYIDGLIFEEGSILCHLCILSRETGIPTVIINSSISGYQTGDHVIISNSSVIKSNPGEQP